MCGDFNTSYLNEEETKVSEDYLRILKDFFARDLFLEANKGVKNVDKIRSFDGDLNMNVSEQAARDSARMDYILAVDKFPISPFPALLRLTSIETTIDTTAQFSDHFPVNCSLVPFS